MLKIPLSRIQRPSQTTPVTTKGSKSETPETPSESYVKTVEQAADFKVGGVNRPKGWKGRLTNAAKTGGLMMAHAAALGVPGGFMAVPAAMTAYAGKKMADQGVELPKSIKGKALLALGVGAVTGLVAASLTVMAAPAAVLAMKTGASFIAGAGVTGGLLGLTSEEIRTDVRVEKGEGSEVFNPQKSDSGYVLGASMTVPDGVFNTDKKTGLAESDHRLVLMPKENLAAAKELGGIKPELNKAVADDYGPSKGIGLNAKVAKVFPEKSQATLAAVVEVPENVLDPKFNKEDGHYHTPFEFVLMPKGTEEKAKELGETPTKIRSAMFNEEGSPIDLEVLTVY